MSLIYFSVMDELLSKTKNRSHYFLWVKKQGSGGKYLKFLCTENGLFLIKSRKAPFSHCSNAILHSLCQLLEDKECSVRNAHSSAHREDGPPSCSMAPLQSLSPGRVISCLLPDLQPWKGAVTQSARASVMDSCVPQTRPRQGATARLCITLVGLTIGWRRGHLTVQVNSMCLSCHLSEVTHSKMVKRCPKHSSDPDM